MATLIVRYPHPNLLNYCLVLNIVLDSRRCFIDQLPTNRPRRAWESYVKRQNVFLLLTEQKTKIYTSFLFNAKCR